MRWKDVPPVDDADKYLDADGDVYKVVNWFYYLCDMLIVKEGVDAYHRV